METDLELVKRLCKETKKNSDEGKLVLKYLKHVDYGIIYLVTKKQLKQKIILNETI